MKLVQGNEFVRRAANAGSVIKERFLPLLEASLLTTRLFDRTFEKNNMRITENRFLQFESLFQVLAGIQKKREHVNVLMTAVGGLQCTT